jgi:hypothetical protein
MHKSLSDIAVPKQGTLAPQHGPGAYDYSHVLDQGHQEAMPGAKIVVNFVPGHYNEGEDPNGWITASLHDSAGKKVGQIHGDVHSKDKDGRKFLAISTAEARGAPREHQGRRLYWGRKMYEAVMAHAKNALGVTHIGGGAHSTYASLAHRWLADRHGMLYDPTPNLKENMMLADPAVADFGFGNYYDRESDWGYEGQKPESMDDRYGPYAYTLKSELSKAEDLSAVPVGKEFTGPASKSNAPPSYFDYDHLLSPEQRENGYHLEVKTHLNTPGFMKGKGIVSARVYQRGMGPRDYAAHVEGFHPDDGTLSIDFSRAAKEHRNQRLGRAAYEALFAHMKNNHNVHTVTGSEHSTAADIAHRAIATKYGLTWIRPPTPQEPQNIMGHSPGSFDYAFSPYALKLHEAVTSGPLEIPLAKEEDEIDPIIARLQAQKQSGWSDPNDVALILQENGVQPKHVAAALRMFSENSIDHRTSIIRTPAFQANGKEILESVFENADTDASSNNRRRHILQALARWPSEAFQTTNPQFVMDALVHQRLHDIAKDGQEHLTSNWKAVDSSSALRFASAHSGSLSNESLANVPLDHADDNSASMRSIFLQNLVNRYEAAGSWPEGIQSTVLDYTKKLLSSLEKSKSIYRNPGAKIVDEAEGVLPHVKKMVAHGIPKAVANSRLSKNMFHSLLATTAPNYPEKKRQTLLDHFISPENIGKANNKAAGAMVAGMWLASPNLSDAHFDAIIANYAQHLPMKELLANPRFNDDLAKRLWTEQGNYDILSAMRNAGKMSPEFGLFVAQDRLGDPEKIRAELADKLATARAKSSRDKAAVRHNYYGNLAAGVPEWYENPNGALYDASGTLHPAHRSNPYSFDAGVFERILGEGGKEAYSPEMFHAFFDRYKKQVQYRPGIPEVDQGFGPREIVGMDSYTQRYYEGTPFGWHNVLPDYGIQPTPDVQTSLANFLVDRTPTREDDNVRAFLHKVKDPTAIAHVLQNGTRGYLISSILERPDVQPEWLAMVEARPEFTTVPDVNDTRYANYSRPSNLRNLPGGNQAHQQDGPEFQAHIRKAVTSSSIFPAEKIGNIIAHAKDYNEVRDFFDHKGWNQALTDQVMDMTPSTYNGYEMDEFGRNVVDQNGSYVRKLVTPGSVPWDAAQHSELITYLLGSQPKTFGPAQWDKANARGMFTLDPNGRNQSFVSHALKNPSLTTAILSQVMNQLPTARIYDHIKSDFKDAILKHNNVDPAVLSAIVDAPNPEKGEFEEYRRLLGRAQLPPELVNRMIERARAFSPEVNPAGPIASPTSNTGNYFWHTLAESPHASEDWLKQVHEQMKNVDATSVNPRNAKYLDSAFGHAVKKAVASMDPDSAYTSFPKAVIKYGSHVWRKLRDLIESAGGQAHISEIQKDPILGKLPVDKARVMREMTPEELARIPEKNRPKVPVKKKTDFVSSEGVQKIIDTIPPSAALNVSYTDWNNGLQQHAYRQGIPDRVFQMNITTDHMKKIREAGLMGVYKTLRGIMKRKFSAHPMTNEGVGWIRHNDVTPENTIHIHEVQSDIRPPGGSWVAAEKGARERGWKGQSINYVVKNPDWGGVFPAAQLDQLNDIIWGKGQDPHKVMLEALREHLRSKGHQNVTMHLAGIGMAGHLRGSGGDAVDEGMRPQLQFPIADNNPHGIVPVAEHMVDTYQRIPKEEGFDMNSSKYGEEPTQKNPEFKGWPYHTEKVRKMEDLIKGIETLPGLPFSHASSGDRIYDASHYLTPEHRRMGYALHIRTGEGQYGPYSIAEVHHGQGNVVGGASMYVNDASIKEGEPRKYGQFDLVGLKDQHIGKKLGLPMYEALLASAKAHHGCTHVRGLQHSSMAHSVHKQLADKHGLKYEAQPNFPSIKYPTEAEWNDSPKAAMDAKWGPYSYTL